MRKKHKKKFTSSFDYLGSYTGNYFDNRDEKPIQDVDDL